MEENSFEVKLRQLQNKKDRMKCFWDSSAINFMNFDAFIFLL